METAHQFAADSDARIVELSTATNNYQAQALYESLGYVRDTDYYGYALVLGK
jgi:ribosomal protein S18 acetylase RimI-like enzyme